jgi:tetratricopeptide (TPR) repeat protein
MTLVGTLLALVLAAAPVARAEPAEPPAREASKHFQRGVDLYNEGDFRGALVEFKKAHALLPRATVLYNIGQTEYQLQEYAPALHTLERFLAETGRNAEHRAEVEETVEVLRGRVGQLTVAVDRAECEVTVDDQAAGTTPLPQPIQVSIGRRKVAVSCAGRPRVVRDVDVAAGENVRVPFKVAAAPLPAAAPTPAPVVEPVSRPPPALNPRTVTTAWLATGALALATAAVYTVAVVEARQLDDLRHSYPITTDRLDDKIRLTTRLALAGDILAVTTLAAAGVSLYLGHELPAEPERGLRLGVGPGALALSGRF